MLNKKIYIDHLKRLFHNRISNAIYISIILTTLASCAHHTDTVGYYKVGNPYKIGGKVYTPKEQPDYDEVGMASWYGSDFHKKETANGGTFDRNTLTAAHKTLPLPCMVRVTNLKNNKTLIVMVNDRGPFSKDRIIDVSESAAEILGFKGSGTTKVRVQYLPGQTKRLLADMPESKKKNLIATKFPGEKDIAAPLDDNENTPLTKTVNSSPENDRNNSAKTEVAKKPEEKIEEITKDAHYVQAGIYSIVENATRVEKNLSSLGTVNIAKVKINGKLLYKVTIGPIFDKKVAELTLKKAITLGHPDAMIVK